jgi:diketogulonate reductase-like aldo/keto reductase
MGGGLRLSSAALVKALRNSVERNGGNALDLWSIHFPFPTWSQTALTEALAQGIDEGLCKAVGVSNYDADQMEEAWTLLNKRGIPLVTNQVKYSVLERAPEKTGLLKIARELDVRIVAYSPLGGGALQSSSDKDIRTLNKLLEFIGAVNGGKTSTQVALNYLMCKGAIPIPSCTSVKRAKEYADCLNFELGVEDIETIDEKLDYVDAKLSSPVP